jgi:hypothetical protein
LRIGLLSIMEISMKMIWKPVRLNVGRMKG